MCLRRWPSLGTRYAKLVPFKLCLFVSHLLLRVCEVCQATYFELCVLVGRGWRLPRTNVFVDMSLSNSGFAAATISDKPVHQFAGYDFNSTDSTRLGRALDVPF